MGIDVYARWEGQTEAEKEAQYTGFSITSGDVGYLREAYHGGPYVTQWLMPEAFELEGDDRRAATERVHAMLAGLAGAFKAQGDTVIEGVVAEGAPEYPPEGYMVEVEVVDDEDGHPVEARIPAAVLEARLPLCEEVYAQRCRAVYGSEPDATHWQSFVDFVALIRKREDAGDKPSIYASY